MRPTTCRFAKVVAIRGVIPFIALLLSLAAAPGWPQELARGELDTTAGRVFVFESFTGRAPIVESVPQIKAIGAVMARALVANGSRGSYFGKYDVVRAFDPAQLNLLSADIIVFRPDAHVNDIRNVQRIVAGYLEAAFSYSPAQAGRLAVLVTNYNAAYRKNIAALSLKYTTQVMSNLTADNAGLALSYKDWPGRTRLVIPLGRAAPGPAMAGPKTATAAPGPASARPGQASTSVAAGAASLGSTGAPQAEAQAQGNEQLGPGAEAGPQAGPPGPAAAEQSEQPTASAPEQGGLPGKAFFFGRSGWLILILALLAAAVIVLVLLGIRILRRGLRPALAGDLHLSAREGHPLVEMVVTMQNRHIGFRNVHYLRPGSSAVVGGGRSTFLIYFVSVPSRMAYLKYDGHSYTFVPAKSALFPDLPGPVADCLGVEIPARSTRGYRFTIVFRKFIPPLDEINRLMRSIRRVG